MLFATAYLPPVSYFQKIISANEIEMEAQEHFVKQSYRNRCRIYSANGLLALSIPLRHHGDKELIIDKKIAYSENWQIRHWRAITSAYKNSPYFMYYEDGLKPFYEKRYDFLLDYNTELTRWLLKCFKIDCKIRFTESYQKNTPLDFRQVMHPKNNLADGLKPYSQVFDTKYGFIPDLSAIDLLFNTGPEAIRYLA